MNQTIQTIGDASKADKIRAVLQSKLSHAQRMETMAQLYYNQSAKASRRAWDSVQGMAPVDYPRYTMAEYRTLADRAVRAYRILESRRDATDSARVQLASVEYTIDLACDGDNRK